MGPQHPPQPASRQDTAAEQRQRAIAIGAIALVVLLFGIFLVSLSGEDEPSPAGASAGPQAGQPVPAGPAGSSPPAVRAPLEKTIDYAHDPLEDAAGGPDGDPFAAMRGQRGAYAAEGEASEPEGELITEGGTPGAVLHCDSFASVALAEEQKARLAFAGMQSTVVHLEGQIMLRLGPFASRDEARERFNQLAAQQLLQQCSLTDVDQP